MQTDALIYLRAHTITPPPPENYSHICVGISFVLSASPPYDPAAAGAIMTHGNPSCRGHQRF